MTEDKLEGSDLKALNSGTMKAGPLFDKLGPGVSLSRTATDGLSGAIGGSFKKASIEVSAGQSAKNEDVISRGPNGTIMVTTRLEAGIKIGGKLGAMLVGAGGSRDSKESTSLQLCFDDSPAGLDALQRYLDHGILPFNNEATTADQTKAIQNIEALKRQAAQAKIEQEKAQDGWLFTRTMANYRASNAQAKYQEAVRALNQSMLGRQCPTR